MLGMCLFKNRVGSLGEIKTGLKCISCIEMPLFGFNLSACRAFSAIMFSFKCYIEWLAENMVLKMLYVIDNILGR